MILKKTAAVLAVITCLGAFSGCSEKELARGSVSDGIYKNSSIDVCFTAPSGWFFYSDDEISEYFGNVVEKLDEGTQNSLDDIECVYDMQAFSASQTESVSVIFENMGKLYGAIIDESTYFSESETTIREQVESYGWTLEAEDVSAVNIGGNEFRCHDLVISADGSPAVYEKQLAHKVGDWMVIITVSAQTESALLSTVNCLTGI